ncbi:hypothetical protein LCGC14_0391400 [marine sediment metagenome]|uniref:Uncharacterized protein n=1 Tax=marine sediment metagenome TaxID=412755 RepID=A0A0F9T5A4_9ZZZZ
MLQIQMSATLGGQIVEYGVSFDGAAAAAGIEIELLECAGAATVTAHVTAGIHRLDAAAMHGGDPVTNLILVGTTATGFTASAEGTLTVVRMFDAQFIQPTNQYVLQFPLGERPYMQPGAFFTRVRVKAAAAVNAICYVVVEV